MTPEEKAREEIDNLPVSFRLLMEQTRIMTEVERRMSVVEELEAVVAANLQRATRLRQSILQKAFTGELVPQTESTNTVGKIKSKLATKGELYV